MQIIFQQRIQKHKNNKMVGIVAAFVKTYMVFGVYKLYITSNDI